MRFYDRYYKVGTKHKNWKKKPKILVTKLDVYLLYNVHFLKKKTPEIYYQRRFKISNYSIWNKRF